MDFDYGSMLIEQPKSLIQRTIVIVAKCLLSAAFKCMYLTGRFVRTFASIRYDKYPGRDVKGVRASFCTMMDSPQGNNDHYTIRSMPKILMLNRVGVNRVNHEIRDI